MPSDGLDDALTIRLALPERGEATRLRCGGFEIVLERVRGGLLLLVHDGQEAQRHYLGVPRDGALALEATAPEHRVQVRLADSVRVAPGGRLCGYIELPLPHRLVWLPPEGRPQPLVEIVPRELRMAWVEDEHHQGYVHCTESVFLQHVEAVEPGAGAVVPVALCNRGTEVVAPAELLLSLRRRELRSGRGRVLAAPRRVVFDGGERPREYVRGFLGRAR